MINLTEEEKRVRNILITKASQREATREERLICYSELIEEAPLKLSMRTPYHRTLLGVMLGNISEYEHEHGRPLLSVIAVKANFKHSDGFFKLAEDLGFGNWEKLKADNFDNTEMTRCFNYWQHHQE